MTIQTESMEISVLRFLKDKAAQSGKAHGNGSPQHVSATNEFNRAWAKAGRPWLA